MQGEIPMEMHRLPGKENMVQTQNKVMRENLFVSPSPFDNDTLYYTETFQESPNLAKLRFWGINTGKSLQKLNKKSRNFPL